jgi:hypothetical protein
VIQKGKNPYKTKNKKEVPQATRGHKRNIQTKPPKKQHLAEETITGVPNPFLEQARGHL